MYIHGIALPFTSPILNSAKAMQSVQAATCSGCRYSFYKRCKIPYSFTGLQTFKYNVHHFMRNHEVQQKKLEVTDELHSTEQKHGTWLSHCVVKAGILSNKRKIVLSTEQTDRNPDKGHKLLKCQFYNWSGNDQHC